MRSVMPSIMPSATVITTISGTKLSAMPNTAPKRLLRPFETLCMFGFIIRSAYKSEDLKVIYEPALFYAQTLIRAGS